MVFHFRPSLTKIYLHENITLYLYLLYLLHAGVRVLCDPMNINVELLW